MAEISASLVMKLRKMSGQGMMDCKKALAENDGDLDKALEELRKKGLATLDKRAGRDTNEGRVLCVASDDNKTAALATLCCETDFVSKSDDFIAAAEKLKDYINACDADEGAEALAETKIDGKSFADVITDTVSKTGEKTEVGDFVRFKIDSSGTIGCYIHFNNKIGAMIAVETSDDKTAQAVKQVADEVCMHISAMNPVALDKDSMPADVIETEKEKAKEQVKNKPPEILEKIIQGKMGKFYSENCLVNQDFVKDDSKTVGKAIEEAAKSAGGTAKPVRFVRFEIGS
jgi:elongation factor Ts